MERITTSDGVRVAVHRFEPDSATEGLPVVVLQHGFAADTVVAATTERRVRRLVIGGVGAGVVEMGGVDRRAVDRSKVAEALRAEDPSTITDPGAEIVVVPGDHLGAVGAAQFAPAIVEFLGR
jgi:hypothetical protein